MNLRNTLLSKRNLTSNSKYWMIHSTYMQLQNRLIYFTGGGGKNKNNGGRGEVGGGAPHLSLPLSPHLLERTEAPRASATLSTRCATPQLVLRSCAYFSTDISLMAMHSIEWRLYTKRKTHKN